MKARLIVLISLILTLTSNAYARGDESGRTDEDFPRPLMGSQPMEIEPTRLILQSAGEEPLSAFDENGKDLGDLEAHALVEVSVWREDAVRYYSRAGLDMGALLRTVAREKNGKTLVPGRLAYGSFLNEKPVNGGEKFWFELSAVTVEKTAAVVGFESYSDRELAFNVNKIMLADSGAGDEAVYAYMMAEDGVSAAELDRDKAKFNLASPTCECKRGSCYSTSGFGPRKSKRTKNGRRMSKYHLGHDVGGGAGTKIIAAADGCVSRVLTNARTGYGLTVFLDHGNGYTTQYSHMSKFNKRSGCIKKGALIGYMGETGNSTAPHLHLGLQSKGKYINPRPHLAEKAIKAASGKCP